PVEGLVSLPQIKFELGNIFARRGDLPTAVQHYWEGLEVTRSMASDAMLREHILFYNNLAYQLHLLKDRTAVEYARQGLALAQQFSVPERIAGLTANLGLVAKQRGQRELAIEHLSSALAQAEALNIRFLATQIRLWLISLVPPTEARAHLAAARSIAEQDGYERLLSEAVHLEA